MAFSYSLSSLLLPKPDSEFFADAMNAEALEIDPVLFFSEDGGVTAAVLRGGGARGLVGFAGGDASAALAGGGLLFPNILANKPPPELVDVRLFPASFS